jgi:hypothetical protein
VRAHYKALIVAGLILLVIGLYFQALEFFAFAQPKHKLWGRPQLAAVKTRWHMIVLLK